MMRHIVAVLMRLLPVINNLSHEKHEFVQVEKPYGLCSACHPINLGHDVEFHLYTRKNPTLPYILQFENRNSLANSYLNPKNKTVILIHGFGRSPSDGFSLIVNNAYLKRDQYNIIRVNWSKLSAGPFEFYPFAVKNIEIVGRHIANFIKWLKHEKVISIAELHIIGFSLGAHVGGFVGKALAPHKVGRITGLDPAGPSFDLTSQKHRLDKTDADFVDVIHTNTDVAGIKSPIGHADFYPNQGEWQPGCIHERTHIGCSHNRSWKYFAESILNIRGFPAVKCQTWTPIVGNCTENPEALMGFGVNKKTRGIFFLQTNSKSPFSKKVKN